MLSVRCDDDTPKKGTETGAGILDYVYFQNSPPRINERKLPNITDEVLCAYSHNYT